MIMAAHQPQYLPWLGYFNKMASCDLFIYLDDVQYKKREYQNRNKIRVKEGWQWLTVPVVSKGRFDQEIRRVEIEPGSSWSHDHWAGIRLAYGKAGAFHEHEAALAALYAQPWTKLDAMCRGFNEWHRGAFRISTPVALSSSFAVTTQKTRRLVDLCKACGADTYLSGQGAKEYLEPQLFTEAGIRLKFQEFRPPAYPQSHPGFEPNMAAADLILNQGARSRDILLGSA